MASKIKITILILSFSLLIGIFLLVDYYGKNSCATTDVVDTSLEIVEAERKVIGLNVDTDELKFGKVSPGAIVKRTMLVNYSAEAEVKVVVEGNFSSWLMITPPKFKIKPEQQQEVVFEVFVPGDAAAGNYTGKVKFCFME
ncbi:MAG: hypothetical protein AABX05_05405 [Nanoarchaeota archaeon]